MKVAMKNIGDITPYKKNPRGNLKAILAVVKSIKEFGFRQPIVVDENGTIVVGHTRYMAALELGMKKVPVHTVTDLTPKQIKAYRVADNQIASIADWDFEKLSSELKELAGDDFEMDILGFLESDLESLIADFSANTEPGSINAPLFSDDDILKAGAHLNDNLKSKDNLIHVTCPECFHEFAVDQPHNK